MDIIIFTFIHSFLSLCIRYRFRLYNKSLVIKYLSIGSQRQYLAEIIQIIIVYFIVRIYPRTNILLVERFFINFIEGIGVFRYMFAAQIIFIYFIIIMIKISIIDNTTVRFYQSAIICMVFLNNL